jgi:predicted nucleic acid-binding protein
MDRVFLDANVLFSIAYDPAARISTLLRLPTIEIVTSRYAAAEALRNIDAKKPRRLAEMRRMLKKVKLVPEASIGILPPSLELAAKDLPILSAAIAAEVSHLLTGDKHFRQLFGRVISSVLVLRPGDYLRLRDAEGSN